MAEIKQGLNYEITANDKSSAVVNKAAETAKKAAKDTEESSKKAGEAFKGKFNPMSAVLAGISGNTEALSQQMLGLASRIKGVHMTMMKFALYAALVMAIVKAVKFLAEKFREARYESEKLTLEKAQGAIENLNAEQAKLNAQYDEARTKTKAIQDNILNELSATEKLTNARREYLKQLELSLAKTDEEKAAIERRHTAETAQDRGKAEKARIAAQREKLQKDIESWESQISSHQDTIVNLKDAKKRAGKVHASAQSKVKDRGAGTVIAGALGFDTGLDDDIEMLNSSAEAMQSATSSINENHEKIKELRASIGAARESLNSLAKADESIDLAMKSEELKAERAEKEAKEEAKKKEEAEKAAAKKIADQKAADEKKAAEKKAADAKKAAEDEAKAIEAAQLKANRRVMEERKSQLATLTEQESQAAARVAAAQSKVAEAWGWYRDKSKMAAQLKEEKAEAEAQKQFEKDFEDLKWRRDWRTAKDLSVDQEAVRRVALAKEEETAAQKALAETAKSTAQAAASLAEIEKVITQEG